MRFKNQTFTEETINLDDNIFEGCTFIRCNVVYKGGLIQMSDNELDAPRFIFDGPALNTIRFMTQLYHGGGREVIEATFDNIRKGDEPIIGPGDSVH